MIVIAGPTGVGKSDLAIRLAEELGGEIVNYDSVQIYRGFDIGSAKPSAEERARVPHHLFDIVDADGRVQRRRLRARRERDLRRHRRPRKVPDPRRRHVLLSPRASARPSRDAGPRRGDPRAPPPHCRAPRGPARLHRWLSKIDPQSGRKIAPADRHRVERALEVWILSGRPISSWERASAEETPAFKALKMALTMERPRLVAALNERVEAMYAAGLIDETRDLLERFPREARPFGTIGYREAAAVVAGEMTTEAAIAETKRRTRATQSGR